MAPLSILVTLLLCSFTVNGQDMFSPWLWRAFPTCPHLMCEAIPENIPEFCIVPGNLMFQGYTICKSCDFVIPECLPTNENLPTESGAVPSPVGSPALRPGMAPQPAGVLPCLHISCPSLTSVNRSCIKEGNVIEFNGAQCRGCDIVDPLCEGLNLDICPNHIVDCTGVPSSAPKKCIDQSVIQYNNRPCLSCPFLKTTEPGCNTPELRRCPGLPCADTSKIPSTCLKEGRMVVLGSSQCQLCPEIDPFCPDLNLAVCPHQSSGCASLPAGIPKECIDQEVIVYQNNNCLTCPKIKPAMACSQYIPRSSPQVQLCPESFCPPLTGIPQNCIKEGELSSFEGVPCKKCPIIDPFCPGLNLQICQNHILDCWGAPRNAPNRCKSQSVISFENRACLTCPYFKTEEPGCIEETYNMCPGIQCPDVKGVPYRCLRQRSQDVGQECSTQCPERLAIPGCPPAPRRPNLSPATPAPPAPSGPFNPRLCPAIMCPDNPRLRNVPESCIRNGFIQGLNGQQCPGCPEIDPACQQQEQPLQICENLRSSCTPIPQGLPSRCYEQGVATYNGQRCLMCPDILPQCMRFNALN
ncbi:uncharacterized protein LOC134276106 [Saccostrea cucullata]|uniref:uncharacterized protein LOC134276106 n=1 Tax=Saccostrea cuccullata TaxID=36930 RepID=UPI002ED1BC2C